MPFELTPGDWFAIGSAVVSVAVGLGVQRARAAADREKLEELRTEVKESNVDQGRRIGALEGWRQAVEAVDQERRRARTGAVPVKTTAPEE